MDLDKLDKSLLEDLKKQVSEGVTTQEEADRLKAMIAGEGK